LHTGYKASRVVKIVKGNQQKSYFEFGLVLDKDRKADIVLESLVNPIDSADISVFHWEIMASKIKSEYSKYDAFIILHGTDTMAYSAGAMDMAIKNLDKPIIFTGSQLPMYDKKTDGATNLLNAINIAVYKESRRMGVCVVFGSKIIKASRAVKTSSISMEGFASSNFNLLGSVSDKAVCFCEEQDKEIEKKKIELEVKADFEREVFYFPIYPECALTLQSMLSIKTKGCVIGSYGSGNIPNDKGLMLAMEKYIENGGVIVNVSQCFHGGVLMGGYKSSNRLLSIGVLSGGTRTAEFALVELMWLLKNVSIKEIKKYYE
jgi:L-asparaginase